MRELTKWSARWNVGNLDVDRLREHLFRLWQLGLDALDCEVLKIRFAHEHLSDTLAVMRRCFAAEEELLARTNCSLLKQHTDDHLVVADKMENIIHCTGCDKDELYEALLDWTNRHVTEIDVLCCGCSKDIHNNGVCKQASERKT